MLPHSNSRIDIQSGSSRDREMTSGELLDQSVVTTCCFDLQLYAAASHISLHHRFPQRSSHCSFLFSMSAWSLLSLQYQSAVSRPWVASHSDADVGSMLELCTSTLCMQCIQILGQFPQTSHPRSEIRCGTDLPSITSAFNPHFEDLRQALSPHLTYMTAMLQCARSSSSALSRYYPA